MIEEDRIKWSVPARFPVLRTREIHLWCAWLDVDGAGDDCTDCLSVDEVARARAFHFAVDRQRFTAARRNLRHVLARYVGRDPARLTFNYGRFGKPLLVHQPDTTNQLDPAVNNLTFNQSHCGSLWLLAVAWNQPLGVDLELVRELSDLHLLESRIFSADELFAQRSLPLPERRLAFFRRWTEREAAAKFHGLGFDPAAPYVPPGQIELLHPTARCVATLAYGGAAVRFDKFQWSPDLPPAVPDMTATRHADQFPLDRALPETAAVQQSSSLDPAPHAG